MRVRALFGETDEVWSHDKGFNIHIREWRGAGKVETKKKTTTRFKRKLEFASVPSIFPLFSHSRTISEAISVLEALFGEEVGEGPQTSLAR